MFYFINYLEMKDCTYYIDNNILSKFNRNIILLNSLKKDCRHEKLKQNNLLSIEYNILVYNYNSVITKKVLSQFI